MLGAHPCWAHHAEASVHVSSSGAPGHSQSSDDPHHAGGSKCVVWAAHSVSAEDLNPLISEGCGEGHEAHGPFSLLVSLLVTPPRILLLPHRLRWLPGPHGT